MEYLSEEDLNGLRLVNTKYDQTRSRIADIAIASYQLNRQLEGIITERNDFNQKLSFKYGEDSIVNLETGEIKKKQNGEDKHIPAGQ